MSGFTLYDEASGMILSASNQDLKQPLDLELGVAIHEGEALDATKYYFEDGEKAERQDLIIDVSNKTPVINEEVVMTGFPEDCKIQFRNKHIELPCYDGEFKFTPLTRGHFQFMVDEVKYKRLEINVHVTSA